jgi:hypothetical protein
MCKQSQKHKHILERVVPTLPKKISARKMGAMKKMCKQNHEWKNKNKNFNSSMHTNPQQHNFKTLER